MSFLEYAVGDTVVAAVDHPEANKYLMTGDTGIVVEVREFGILVDWKTEPNDACFHRGKGARAMLPTPTGWWIYHTNHVTRCADDAFPVTEMDISAPFD